MLWSCHTRQDHARVGHTPADMCVLGFTADIQASRENRLVRIVSMIVPLGMMLGMAYTGPGGV